MNRILLLILIAAGVFLVILFAVKPELIDNIWLWLVGLAGVLVKSVQWLFNSIKNAFEGSGKTAKKVNSSVSPVNTAAVSKDSFISENKISDTFEGVTIRLFRFYDDGHTTLGLLTINGKFFCYTLEDTYHQVKVPKETRIPAGTYEIKFRKIDSEFTLRMRNRHGEWFTYFPELQNVPGFSYVYIHSGNSIADTDGCILVADSIDGSKPEKLIKNSLAAFQRLYVYITKVLNSNSRLRIIIYDEKWMNNLK